MKSGNIFNSEGELTVFIEGGLCSILPLSISDSSEEQREHTLHPGTIEISKLNKSRALLLVIITFPK